MPNIQNIPAGYYLPSNHMTRLGNLIIIKHFPLGGYRISLRDRFKIICLPLSTLKTLPISAGWIIPSFTLLM